MAQPVSYAGWTYADSTIGKNGKPETSQFQVAITALTAANVVAQTGLIDALTTAIEAVVLGNLQKTEVVLERDLISQSPANDQLAQREIKLLLRYTGNTSGKEYQVSIPTFDLSLLPLHSEFLDLTAGVGLALKDAFQDVVRSPNDDSETVTLQTAQFVGRNT